MSQATLQPRTAVPAITWGLGGLVLGAAIVIGAAGVTTGRGLPALFESSPVRVSAPTAEIVVNGYPTSLYYVTRHAAPIAAASGFVDPVTGRWRAGDPFRPAAATGHVDPVTGRWVTP
jgi:hypothetical protein